MTEHLVISVLLSFLVVIAVGIIVLRDLLAGVILLGLYSLVAAGAFVVMDAVDVAFTEAAVGAGISTILFLGALSFTSHEQKRRGNDSLVAVVFVVVTGGLLIYGTLDMPHYGSATSPAQTHPELAVRFIERSAGEVGPPNLVTSVLASYRGYDTLGETVVVFAAGIAVLSLLGLRRRPSTEDAPTDAPGDVPADGPGHGPLARAGSAAAHGDPTAGKAAEATEAARPAAAGDSRRASGAAVTSRTDGADRSADGVALAKAERPTGASGDARAGGPAKAEGPAKPERPANASGSAKAGKPTGKKKPGKGGKGGKRGSGKRKGRRGSGK